MYINIIINIFNIFPYNIFIFIFSRFHPHTYTHARAHTHHTQN